MEEGPGASGECAMETAAGEGGRAAWKAAGVLPWAWHAGAVHVLLGAELCSAGPARQRQRVIWRDFGGRREEGDADPEATASREFAEETLGVFHGGLGVTEESVARCAEHTAAQLRARWRTLRVVHQLKEGQYHMFVAEVPYVEALMLSLAGQQNAETGAVEGAEKVAFAWVPLGELLSATAQPAPHYQLWQTPEGVQAAPPQLPGPRRKRLPLHSPFAASLRLAAAQGLGELVAPGADSLQPLPDDMEGCGLPAPGPDQPPPQAISQAMRSVFLAAQRGPGRKGLRGPEVEWTPKNVAVTKGCGYWLAQDEVATMLRLRPGEVTGAGKRRGGREEGEGPGPAAGGGKRSRPGAGASGGEMECAVEGGEPGGVPKWWRVY